MRDRSDVTKTRRIAKDGTEKEHEDLLAELSIDRTRALAILGELIQDPEIEVREWAIDTTASVLGPAAAPLLLKAAKDRDPGVRDLAIERLLESHPVAARSLVPLLLRKLNGPEFFDAVGAMWALAQLRRRDALDEIREAGQAGRRAGKTFQGITADVVNDLLEGRDTELVAALERHDHDRMSALAKAASLIGSPEALAVLRRCAESAPDEDCRLACAAALRRGVEHE